jgi:beta-phosphoglucomutase-like phosphatase (HAD superfamily)
MKIKAVIFDVDGTLANTERYGHLPACNEAFKKMDLPIKWEWNYFKDLMKTIQGNANRLRGELDQKFQLSKIELEAIIIEFEVLKKELYIVKYLPQVQLRNGVIDFIKLVNSAGLKMAIVSTSYEVQIHELIKKQLGAYYKNFNPILGKESGVKTGEDGVLYTICANKLGVSPIECLAIEDSEVGLQAALKAGIPTIITYNEYTQDENFEGAITVLPSLESIEFDEILKRTNWLKNNK